MRQNTISWPEGIIFMLLDDMTKNTSGPCFHIQFKTKIFDMFKDLGSNVFSELLCPALYDVRGNISLATGKNKGLISS